MTPKLQGLAAAMARLHHGLEARSDKLLARIESADARSDAAFKKAHAKLDAAEAAMDDVDKFVAEIERSNGGPTLDGSSESSDLDHPQKSWAGDKVA